MVVVDDGSRDDTTVQLARDAGVRVLQNPGNRGKGYSVRHGMLEAQGRVGAVHRCRSFLAHRGTGEALERGGARGRQVAVGSRAVDRSLVGVHQPMFREAVGRVLQPRDARGDRPAVPRYAVRLQALRDQPPAREVFSRQQLDGFGFDVEVLFIAQQLGLSSGGSPGALGQRGRHEGEPAARVYGLPGPLESPLERAAGKYK